MDARISARAVDTALGGWRTREPAYEALADGIRLLCLDGRIVARTVLPAERVLAQVLGVSRTTVAAAYASLRASGHIRSVRGSGSVTVAQPVRGSARLPVSTGAIDLQQASPPAWPGLAGVISEAAAEAASLVARAGYDTLGSSRLRAEVAAHYSRRGLPTREDEVMITPGAQSAIHLIGATLLHRGDRVMIETPTYPHAADALRRSGARFVCVPIAPEHGWDVERAREVLERTRPPLAYLMPVFQNPTGGVMSATEQAELAEAARRAGCRLIVDDTTADLHFGGAPAPDLAFASTDVIRVGSVSKTVWGGLRVGWIRAEASLIDAFHAARPPFDLGTAELEQSIAARVLPRMPEIVRQRGPQLQAGHAAATGALAGLLPDWRVPEVAGGVALWVGLPAPLSASLVLAARQRGVFLTAGARFGVDGGHEARLRVPFTAPPADLEAAIAVIADAWADVVAGAPVSRLPMIDSVV